MSNIIDFEFDSFEPRTEKVFACFTPTELFPMTYEEVLEARRQIDAALARYNEYKEAA